MSVFETKGGMFRSIKKSYSTINSFDKENYYSMEVAVWWYCHDYYTGIYCPLYATMCQSPYRPGTATTSKDLEFTEKMYYNHLVRVGELNPKPINTER